MAVRPNGSHKLHGWEYVLGCGEVGAVRVSQPNDPVVLVALLNVGTQRPAASSGQVPLVIQRPQGALLCWPFRGG